MKLCHNADVRHWELSCSASQASIDSQKRQSLGTFDWPMFYWPMLGMGRLVLEHGRCQYNTRRPMLQYMVDAKGFDPMPNEHNGSERMQATGAQNLRRTRSPVCPRVRSQAPYECHRKRAAGRTRWRTVAVSGTPCTPPYPEARATFRWQPRPAHRCFVEVQ